MKKKIVSRFVECGSRFSDRMLYGLIAVKNSVSDRMRCDKGASTVEYALVIGVIVLMIIGAASVMEGPLQNFFKGIIDKIAKFAGV